MIDIETNEKDSNLNIFNEPDVKNMQSLDKLNPIFNSQYVNITRSALNALIGGFIIFNIIKRTTAICELSFINENEKKSFFERSLRNLLT